MTHHFHITSRIFRNKLLKLFPCSSNIKLRECGGNACGIASHHQHHVGVAREQVNQRAELRVTYFHRLKLTLSLGTTQFELLDDV